METTLQSRGRVVAVTGAVLLAALYAAGINPWYLPDAHDDVLYHEAARSLATGEGYAWHGERISDWPPGFAVVLSIAIRLGFGSIAAAKLLVAGLAALALVTLWRLLTIEGRPRPGLTVVAMALLPAAFQAGTRIMSEWPYMLWSFLFLLVLDRLARARERRVAWAVLAGLLLGASALTRYVGVFLGAALLFQAVRTWRQAPPGRRLAAVWPLGLAAGLGASLFVAWVAFVASSIGFTDARNAEAAAYAHFEPVTMLGAIANVVLNLASVLRHLGVAGTALGALVGLVAITGFVLRLRSGRASPSDAYALAVLAFTIVYEGSPVPVVTRYLVPIAPFCLGALAAGASHLATLAGADRRPGWSRVVALGIGLWLAGLTAMDLTLVAVGKPGGAHGGLSPLVSPTAADFYRGRWRDLWDACLYVRERPEPGSVTELPWPTRYLAAFSGRETVSFLPGRGQEPAGRPDLAFLLAPDGEPVPAELTAAYTAEPLARFGTITLLRTARR